MHNNAYPRTVSKEAIFKVHQQQQKKPMYRYFKLFFRHNEQATDWLFLQTLRDHLLISSVSYCPHTHQQYANALISMLLALLA